MINFPNVGVLPMGNVAPVVVIQMPIVIALGFATALLIGLVCVTRFYRQPRRRTILSWRAFTARLALPFTASKGGVSR
jgi:hypothetical protein